MGRSSRKIRTMGLNPATWLTLLRVFSRDSFIFSGGQIRTVRITWCGSCTQSDALEATHLGRPAKADKQQQKK